jgi:hypothetical protein
MRFPGVGHRRSAHNRNCGSNPSNARALANGQLDGDVAIGELGLELEDEFLHHHRDHLLRQMREGDDGIEPVAHSPGDASARDQTRPAVFASRGARIDPGLKTGPNHVGFKGDAEVDDGIGLYRYRYVWSDTSCVGVMAQEVVAAKLEAN